MPPRLPLRFSVSSTSVSAKEAGGAPWGGSEALREACTALSVIVSANPPLLLALRKGEELARCLRDLAAGVVVFLGNR
eukprot:2009367-Amphidinium_carterae.1